MVREAHKRRGSVAGKIGALALVNIVPLAGLGWLGWALYTKRISTDDFPEALGRNGVLAGVSLALLFVAASLLLPFVHGLAKRLRGSLAVSRQIRAEAGAGRQVLEWLLWPFRALFYLVFWILRAALYLISLALIAAIVLFAVRIARPDFGEDWLPVNDTLAKAEAWIDEKRG